jgi:hypothetical protein
MIILDIVEYYLCPNSGGLPDTGSAWPLCNATVKLLGKRLKYIGSTSAT